jgi:hypothetical protein
MRNYQGRGKRYHISRAEGEADNAYQDLDNFAYRKN